MGFFDFDHDDDFDLEDLIQADIQYGLFKDDNKSIQQRPKQKKKNTEIKTFWDIFKV